MALRSATLALAAALAASPASAAVAAAAERAAVAAVLSAETGPYEQALAGLRDELGAGATALVLAEGEPRLPQGTRVLVLFGAKAALWRTAPGLPAVYAMAPGAPIPARALESGVVVAMIPDPAVLLASLGELQPGLRRLGVLWRSEGSRAYVERLRQAADAAGVRLDAEPAGASESLQDRLRRLYAGRPDAVWLMPDPLLISTANLVLLKDFSWENRIPLYVPTEGLVGHGALASVGVSFREIGREAARSARPLLSGDPAAAGEVYPKRVELAVDLAAARRLGRAVPEAVLRRADKVLP